MNIHDLIVPLGITTYTLLFVTIITGIKRVKLKIHKVLAIITLIIATLHALIVIFN